MYHSQPPLYADLPPLPVLPPYSILYVVTVFLTVSLLLFYMGSIRAALDKHVYAKLPRISLLITNKSRWLLSKTAKASTSALPGNTTSRQVPRTDFAQFTLNKILKGLFNSQPSDSRDRDKSNIDANTESKSYQEQVNSTSSEIHRVAEELPSEITTEELPSQVTTEELPSEITTKDPVQLVASRVQQETTSTVVTDNDNDTITLEDAHTSPPDSPIPTHRNRAALSVEYNTHESVLTTKRRRRRPQKNKRADSHTRTSIPGDDIRIQQPTPRPSRDANLTVDRPTGSHLNPPPGFPPLYFHRQTERKTDPRPPVTPTKPEIPRQTYPTRAKSAPRQTILQPSHSAPPPLRVSVARSPLAGENPLKIAPEPIAGADVANANARMVPRRPWSPFASGLNIELGSQTRPDNNQHLSHVHQRSSSTGSLFANSPRNYNFNGSFTSSLPILKGNVDQRFGPNRSVSLFSNPNPSSRLNPTSSLFVSQPAVAFSKLPTAPMPTTQWESYSPRQFSLFDKRLTFTSGEER